ncbi:MAG: hypothetical protein QXD77_02070 [Candidatus Aenigmatarchaeota archaeon]
MHQTDILAYYSRQDVQRAITAAARDRETGCAMRDGTYMKRPDIILYPSDVLDRVKRGAVTFHISVERWTQPLAIRQDNLEEIRKGWDLIIDMDSKAKLEHGRAAAATVVDFLKDYRISPTVKFSGRRGFHLAVAGNAFPPEVDFRPIAKRYPEVPQAIAQFIKDKCKEKIMEALIAEEGGLAALRTTVESMPDLSPYHFVEIEKDWGNRHLFRAPYSLHDKTWLVSTPVRIFKLRSFSTDMAKPEAVKADLPFLANKDGEGYELLLDALDHAAKTKPADTAVKPKPRAGPKSPIPEQFFPPCIKAVLCGLADGRKRSVFTLAAFLRSAGWKEEDIEKKVLETNKLHKSPLPERTIRTQMRWHGRQNRDMMPANCASEQFYDSIGLCRPDELCNSKNIKNPVNYAHRAMARAARLKMEAERAESKHKSVKGKRIKRAR